MRSRQDMPKSLQQSTRRCLLILFAGFCSPAALACNTSESAGEDLELKAEAGREEILGSHLNPAHAASWPHISKEDAGRSFRAIVFNKFWEPGQIDPVETIKRPASPTV